MVKSNSWAILGRLGMVAMVLLSIKIAIFVQIVYRN